MTTFADMTGGPDFDVAPTVHFVAHREHTVTACNVMVSGRDQTDPAKVTCEPCTATPVWYAASIEADHDHEVNRHRQAVQDALNTLGGVITDLDNAVSTLVSDGVYDVEYAEGPARDVIDTSLRTIRMCHAAIRGVAKGPDE